jgi:DNA-binding FrmR family transcriptional regulator
MKSRMPAPVAGAAMCLAVLLSVIAVAASTGCAREEGLGFSKSTPATPEELLAELKTHQEKIDKATEGMLQRINEFNQARKPGERTIQFSEIFSQDFSDQQKEVLNQMIAEEKDVSYKSILQQIVADRDAIQGLQEKVMHLEQSLPDSFVIAKKGDKHHDLAMNYLISDAKVEEAKAKTLLADADQTDELLAGNKVWFFYDPARDTFRTYVTQGEAGQTPLAVRRAMKRRLIGERDQALAQRDEAATARDEAVRAVNDLQQVKTTLESDISVLRQNKAALEASVERLSSDLAFRQNSLFYHAANVRELKDQGVLTSVLKRVQDVKPVNYDTALDLRQTTTITLAPAAFGLDRIGKVRMLPNIFQEGRDFRIETSDGSGVATVVILDPDLFKGKEVLFAVGG